TPSVRATRLRHVPTATARKSGYHSDFSRVKMAASSSRKSSSNLRCARAAAVDGGGPLRATRDGGAPAAIAGAEDEAIDSVFALLDPFGFAAASARCLRAPAMVKPSS